MAYASREEIAETYRWDLSSIYENDAAFEQALAKAQEYPARYAAYQGTIASSPAQLLAFMHMDDEAGIELGKLVNYAQRKADEDTSVSKYQA